MPTNLPPRVAFISKVAGELLPTFHVLYFVKEQHGPFAIHFLVTFKDKVEVLCRETIKPRVFKIKVQHIRPTMSIVKHFADFLKQEVSFA